MKVVDKTTGYPVKVLSLEGDPTVNVMSDGVVSYRKVSELEFHEQVLNLNDTVKVTLTREGAYHLNNKGWRNNGKKWKSGDVYITVFWKLLPTFTKFFHPGGDSPFKNLQSL